MPHHRTGPALAAALGIAVLTGLAAAPAALAEPTEVTVRALTRNGKFIGTSLGGARILLHDTETGELLAQGVTAGSTGDTQRIMLDAHPRGTPVATGDAAGWTTTLDLDRPTRVRATATAPLAQPQALVTVSAEQWLLPGRDYTVGDGWVLEVPGMVVDVLDPPAHIKLADAGDGIGVHANIMMMCGCPIEPGGLWDAEATEVVAVLYRDGERVGETPLDYAGTPSQFETTLQVDRPGTYEVVVQAYREADGNSGLDRTTFIIEE
jgi:hypothetical protein